MRRPSWGRDGGFGRDLCDALARRRQWLIGQDLARMEQGRIVYRANLLRRSDALIAMAQADLAMLQVRMEPVDATLSAFEPWWANQLSDERRGQAAGFHVQPDPARDRLDLDALRAELGTLDADQRHVGNAPLPPEEARARVQAAIADA